MYKDPTSQSTLKSDFTVRPWTIVRPLVYIVVVLTTLNVVSNSIRLVLQHTANYTERFPGYFDFNTENNLPSYFSSLLHLLASAFLMVLAVQALEKATAHRWWLLSAIFLFLGLDEATQIHERISKFIRHTLLNLFDYQASSTGGYFLYIWVVPYVIALVALTAFYAPFLFRLPSRIRNLFVLSACIFVGGAAGLEVIEGRVDLLYGNTSVYSTILYSVEEVMEMAGVILFIYALSLHIATTKGEIGIRLLTNQEVHPDGMPINSASGNTTNYHSKPNIELIE